MDQKDVSSDDQKLSLSPIDGFINQPIFVVDLNGEVQIQLEGSHTTSSITESENVQSPRNVQFDEGIVNNQVSSQTLLARDGIGSDEVCGSPKIPENQRENEEIAERFKQIMNMFDAFTKNLESLDMSPTPSAVKTETIVNINELSADCGKPQTSYCQSEAGEVYYSSGAYNSGNPNCLALQTSFHENASIGQSSKVTVSVCSSKSELLLSLNNYTNADNVCHRVSTEDDHSVKNQIKEIPSIQNVSHDARTADEGTTVPTFHTIHIDTSVLPSSSVMRRPPMCQRLWDSISDFCAAICLCLQPESIATAAVCCATPTGRRNGGNILKWMHQMKLKSIAQICL
ncbi:uncharacterized protein LOC101901179 isoform X2 [Musca domestica]|uniref:Uncharacterized protein LOC101901179 isoform X2 n=1 Tax=Musca domestica TaxID=7370 RepID=A0A1I8MJG9_MUSDO|nr:uncharacterized protein LOC101901179 isoform X2 [Musca domestica]